MLTTHYKILPVSKKLLTEKENGLSWTVFLSRLTFSGIFLFSFLETDFWDAFSGCLYFFAFSFVE